MNDLVQQILGGLVRTAIAAFGAWAAAGGVVLTGTQLDQLSGAALILAMAGWSAVQKWIAAQTSRTAQVAAAVASVEKGSPVVVTVTPEGQPNVATKISATEQAAAPSVPMSTPPQPAPPTP
jgi:hypothetical protein